MRREPLPLFGDVLGRKARNLRDLSRGEWRHCHDLTVPHFIAARELLHDMAHALVSCDSDPVS